MEPGSETVWQLYSLQGKSGYPIDLPRGASMGCGRDCDPHQSVHVSREQLTLCVNQDNQLWLTTSGKALNASVLQQAHSMKILTVEQGEGKEIQDGDRVSLDLRVTHKIKHDAVWHFMAIAIRIVTVQVVTPLQTVIGSNEMLAITKKRSNAFSQLALKKKQHWIDAAAEEGENVGADLAYADMRNRSIQSSLIDIESECSDPCKELVKYGNEVALQTLVGLACDKTRCLQELSLQYAAESTSPFRQARLLAAFGCEGLKSQKERKAALGNVASDTKLKHCNNPLGFSVHRVCDIIQENKQGAANSLLARAIYACNILAVRSPGCNHNSVCALTDEKCTSMQSDNSSYRFPPVSGRDYFLVLLTESTNKGCSTGIVIAECIRIVFWDWIPTEHLEAAGSFIAGRIDAALDWLNDGLQTHAIIPRDKRTAEICSVEGSIFYDSIRQNSCIPRWTAEPEIQCYHIERSLFANFQIYCMDQSFFVPTLPDRKFGFALCDRAKFPNRLRSM